MKKYIAIIILILAAIFINGCSSNQTESFPSANRLEGYYISNFTNGCKLKFEITDIAAGDYGGEITDMNNTSVIYSYYLGGNQVYVDGELTYIYVEPYLACVNTKTNMNISDENQLSITDRNQVTGTYKFTVHDTYGSFTREYNFFEDGTIKRTRYRNNQAVGSDDYTYTVQDNIIFCNEEDVTLKAFIIYEGRIYPLFERI